MVNISYLQQHYQRVKTNHINSNSLPIQTGMPQGSILGPILFLNYINDIIHLISNTRINLIFNADIAACLMTTSDIDKEIADTKPFLDSVIQ